MFLLQNVLVASSMTTVSLDEVTFKRVFGGEAEEYLNRYEDKREYDIDALEDLAPNDYARKFWEAMYASSPEEFIDGLVREVYRDQDRYTLPGGYDSFEQDAREFEVSYRPQLDEYMKSMGRKAYDLAGITRGYLGPDAVAGLAMDKESGTSVLIGNTNYEHMRDMLAAGYRMPAKWAGVYAQAHEHMHRWQYGLELSEQDAERDVESMLTAYFNHMAGVHPEEAPMYGKLASVARDRMFHVGRNYGKPSPSVQSALPYAA